MLDMVTQVPAAAAALASVQFQLCSGSVAAGAAAGSAKWRG